MVAGAGVAGNRLLAAGPLVVAQDGSGTFTSITDAVAVAQDGDTVLVKPGTYVESIEITKDITLRGDGDLGDVVIEITAESATTAAKQAHGPVCDPPGGYHRDGCQPLRQGPRYRRRYQVSGGAPNLEDLVIELAGEYRNAARDAFDFTDGAAGTMTDVKTDGFAQIRAGASPTIVRLEHRLEGLLILLVQAQSSVRALSTAWTFAAQRRSSRTMTSSGLTIQAEFPSSRTTASPTRSIQRATNSTTVRPRPPSTSTSPIP